jgi:high-affinity nickel-transport protein
MDSLPHDWLALAFLAFVVGMRHGLDADHLVAIDGLTRLNAASNARLARWCGALFSLGHGVIIMLIALAVGALAASFAPPRWLADVGAWVSIAFLLALGVLNAAAVLTTRPEEPVRLVGVKARFARPARASHPLFVAAVGALFALSFDTVSQAALFAVAATQLGGVAHALALGALFTLGMLLVDASNGAWMFRMVLRVNRRALIASRVFAVVVSSLSFAVAALGIARYFSLGVERWGEGKELAIGVAVLALVILGFALAMGAAKVRTAD